MAQFVRGPKTSVDMNDNQVLVKHSMNMRCDDKQHLVVVGGEGEEVPSKRLALVTRLCIQDVCDEGNIQHATWKMGNGMDVPARRCMWEVQVSMILRHSRTT